MKPPQALLVFVCVVITSGCASTFNTRPAVAADDAGIENGIIYYEPAPYLVRTEFTAYVKEGKATAIKCAPVTDKIEIQYHPGRKMVIVQKPSNFSSSTFGVTLNPNGTLAAISTATTPVGAQLLGTLESAAKDIAAFGAPTNDGTPACNANAMISHFKKIDSFEKIPEMLSR